MTAEDSRNIHVNSIGNSGDHDGIAPGANDETFYETGSLKRISTGNITIGGTDVAFANIPAGTYTPTVDSARKPAN